MARKRQEWDYVPSKDDSCGHEIVAGLVRVIAVTVTADSVKVTEEEEANARLIAAAPELLEACLQALDHIGSEQEGDAGAEQRVFGILQAAIAKAEGGRNHEPP